MKKRDVFLIMTEDICPNYGCYGDVNAKTPNIDAFAKDNIRFTYCSSAAPVCSAARTSLNLGMFGSTAGVGQHRSMQALPENVKNIGAYMKDAGYFTVIGKTDFNFPGDGDNYDMKVQTTSIDSYAFAQSFADAMEKAGDKPLFIVQTEACTHQSQYGYTQSKEEHRATMPRLKEEEYQIRENVVVPDYHFDSEEAREVWAQYHEKMTTLDRMFGETIDLIKKNGKYEDSIIFFVGDNGHGIPAGKCNLWDEGVHVPFLLHVPKDMEAELELKEDEKGKYCDRLTSFIDFPPTILSLAGAPVPPQHQGNILLGDAKVSDPSEVYSFSERVDEVFENARCIREKDKLFTCDFGYSDYRRLNKYQSTTSPWFVRSMIEKGYENEISDLDRRAHYRAIPRVIEQMFDMVGDKAQFDNLALHEDQQDELVRMRNTLLNHVLKLRDGVFMPEPLCVEINKKTGLTVYEIFRNDDLYPLETLINDWKAYVVGGEPEVIGENPCQKIMHIKFSALKGDMDAVAKYFNDDSETVRAYAAYKAKKSDIVAEVCETTENLPLLMFIADLIAFWMDEDGLKCLEVLCRKYFPDQNYDFDERFKSPMRAAITMLAARFKFGIKNCDTPEPWKQGMIDNVDMVLSALKYY